MRTFAQPNPLTDADRLDDFLKSCKGGKAMNLEELDGFFAALIAGPEPVMPSEYNREVFGGEMGEACEFKNIGEANEIFGLLMRHRNAIASTLYKGEIHVPLISEDKNGELHGNDWAHGFMRGMHMRHEGWAELVNDEKYGGSLIPMMALHHEHDEDPEMRSDPITPEKRAQVIALMAAGLMNACEYFRKERAADLSMHAHEPRSNAARSGATIPAPAVPVRNTRNAAGSLFRFVEQIRIFR